MLYNIIAVILFSLDIVIERHGTEESTRSNDRNIEAYVENGYSNDTVVLIKQNYNTKRSL